MDFKMIYFFNIVKRKQHNYIMLICHRMRPLIWYIDFGSYWRGQNIKTGHNVNLAIIYTVYRI